VSEQDAPIQKPDAAKADELIRAFECCAKEMEKLNSGQQQRVLAALHALVPRVEFRRKP
jgi:ABC-type Mn2+/Zn2+ transport system ATPase subunit